MKSRRGQDVYIYLVSISRVVVDDDDDDDAARDFC